MLSKTCMSGSEMASHPYDATSTYIDLYSEVLISILICQWLICPMAAFRNQELLKFLFLPATFPKSYLVEESPT